MRKIKGAGRSGPVEVRRLAGRATERARAADPRRMRRRRRIQRRAPDISPGRSADRKRASRAAAGGVAAGAAGAFFLDPRSGRRRRHVARDRIAGLLRRGGRGAARATRYRSGQAAGKASKLRAALRRIGSRRPAPNDEALAERVKSEIFRPADAPKDRVVVNAEDGIVYLRGQVKRPEEIEALTDAARTVDGVRDVEALLHLPGADAPSNRAGATSRG